MIELTPLTNALPVVSVAVTPADRPLLSPSLFQNVFYSPDLLLPASFDSSITADPDYQGACESGFDHYFGVMFVWGEDEAETVFVDHFPTEVEVRQFVIYEMLPGEHNQCPLPSRVGVVLGWLSALALTDRDLALKGLGLLSFLADCLSSCASGSVRLSQCS